MAQTQQIELSNELTVELVDFMGKDLTTVNAARVSLNQHSDEWTERDAGLVSFLMKNQHACYDSETDVLTSNGWKNWTDVDGTESFITLNLETDEIELQRALAVIHEPYIGNMIKMSMSHVDALVTPNHRMVASPRTNNNKIRFDLHEAAEFQNRSYRLRMGGGEWGGEIHAPELAELVGLITADGHVSKTTIAFSLVKQRTIDYLTERAEVSISTHSNPNAKTYRILRACEQLKLWAKQTYTESGDRCFPRELLERADQETLQALLDGYLEGDGSVSSTGKITASTVSRQLVDDLQELALKVGMAATEIKSCFPAGGFNTANPRTLYRLCFYRERNSLPKIGWTQEARTEQVQEIPFDGIVHCVSVPNKTLYVRRNGKPMWSGNSPFEHCAASFLVTAPIFVAREWFRHRTFSYNETSGRYTKLLPRFYAPSFDRPLIQVGKPGAYYFETSGDELKHLDLLERFRFSAQTCWDEYEQMMDLGYAKEVARMVLPVNIYSKWYATGNLRNWVGFLNLRTDEQAMFEIRHLAYQVEEQLIKLFPATMAEWIKNGRNHI